MNIKKALAVLATAASLTAPIALAGPAQAQAAPVPCVRITAPGDHSVQVGETSNIHVRLSAACRGSKIAFDSTEAVRPNLRHVLYSSTYYIPGQYTLTLRVTPPKGEGKTVNKSFTYTVAS